MNNSTTVFLINKNVRAMAGFYEPGGKREIFKTLDPDIKKDDLVVTTTETRFKFTIVKISDADVAVDIDDPNLIVRWIVGKVDTAAHEEIVKQEAVAVERVKQAEFNKRRRDLLANMVTDDDAASIKSLTLYANGSSAPAPTENNQ